MDNCYFVSRVKIQGQDFLEVQFSLLESSRRVYISIFSDKNLLDIYNFEFLKFDLDNNNSDDCGNILFLDIMDFVLKNILFMQALGESLEFFLLEFLNFGEGLGFDGNREKDMGFFEVFFQQLLFIEFVDSSVFFFILVEEQFELFLELLFDFFVLIIRSFIVFSQNFSRLVVILDLGEKRVIIIEKFVVFFEGDLVLLSLGVDLIFEGYMIFDYFI